MKVAVPPLRTPQPRILPPSSKVTVPVGMPTLGATAVTVAVKVTAWPAAVGLADAVIVTTVAAGSVFCRMLPLLVLKLALPP